MGKLMVCALLVLACSGVMAKPPEASRSTVLLSVYVNDGGASSLPVDGLIVNIEGGSHNPGGQLAFPADPVSAIGRALFLVRADLTPGYYRLSRLSGVMRGGGDDLRFDVEVDMAFEVRNGMTDYLGSVELSRPSTARPADARITLSDGYKEDRPRFIRAWPELRSRMMQRRKLSPITLTVRAPPQAPEQKGSGQYMPPVQLDRTAERLLPAKARPAFRAFLKTRPPRAFAYAGSGSFGSASGGENVVGRALKSCQRTTIAKQDCKLFALDDTLVSSINWSTKPAPPSGSRQ